MGKNEKKKDADVGINFIGPVLDSKRNHDPASNAIDGQGKCQWSDQNFGHCGDYVPDSYDSGCVSKSTGILFVGSRAGDLHHWADCGNHRHDYNQSHGLATKNCGDRASDRSDYGERLLVYDCVPG